MPVARTTATLVSDPDLPDDARLTEHLVQMRKLHCEGTTNAVTVAILEQDGRDLRWAVANAMGYLVYAADLAADLQAMGAARRIRLNELDGETPDTVQATSPVAGDRPVTAREMPGPLHPGARAMRTEPSDEQEWTVAIDQGTTLDALVELLTEGVPDGLRVRGVRAGVATGSVELVLGHMAASEDG
jgi:hypothetical protein